MNSAESFAAVLYHVLVPADGLLCVLAAIGLALRRPALRPHQPAPEQRFFTLLLGLTSLCALLASSVLSLTPWQRLGHGTSTAAFLSVSAFWTWRWWRLRAARPSSPPLA